MIDSADKRQVSVLARDGNLPFVGKRFIDAEDPESMISEDEGALDQETLGYILNKRYVGALAKTGDLARYKQANDKRDDVDTLIDELLTAEELSKIRLDALRDEILKQEEGEKDFINDKRSSLARFGSPYYDGKRNIASMAKMGYLRSPSFSVGGFEKRGISSLARNGELPYYGKRGGISSVMRNGFSSQKRNYDYDLDNFLLEDELDNKRNVASLARDYSLPSMGERNIASFARNGWIRNLVPNSKKSNYYYWDDSLEESKRNIPSLLRNKAFPISEGKRYLGAFVARNSLPNSRQNFKDSKRNIAAMVRNWNNPGKRDVDNADDTSNNGLVKRYVSSLLKQGPLPISTESIETNSEENQSFAGEEQSKVENTEDMSEEKRQIGSFLGNKNFVMRKKKSITAEDQLDEQPATVVTATKPRTDENKMNNNIQHNQRQKREAFEDFPAEINEYSMPVKQKSDMPDYDEENLRSIVDQSTRKKRYFGALARSGWLPTNHYYKGAVSKRHIGALARLGWLPSFRNIRGYNRIGRTVRSTCKRSSPELSSEGWRKDSGWEVAARGKVTFKQPQLWTASRRPLDFYRETSGSEDDEVEEKINPTKRYLLIPALDNILLRRNPINWIHY